MANDGHILIPTGVQPHFPRKMVMPGPMHHPLRCKCGKLGPFRLHVEVLPKEGTARIGEAVCVHCGQVHKVDPQGRFVRGGKLDVLEKRDG